jgi:Tfp pilus assembly protein PilV
MRRPPPRQAAARQQAGFMLLSVLLAATIFAMGLLGFSLAYARFTSAVAQDQFLRQMAPASNAFWALVQANPAVMTSMAGTWTAGNYTSAPAALQPWLAQLTSGSSALPGASIVIATGGDAVAGGSCSTTAGCTATVSISWTQNANASAGQTAAITRTQTFSYQFGL